MPMKSAKLVNLFLRTKSGIFTRIPCGPFAHMHRHSGGHVQHKTQTVYTGTHKNLSYAGRLHAQYASDVCACCSWIYRHVSGHTVSAVVNRKYGVEQEVLY